MSIKKTELEECIKSLSSEKERWISICKSGCNDPAYSDGVNMNLVRNHMIYYKRKIQEICNEMETGLPEEYYIAIPPTVSNGYMANLKQKERIQRLVVFGNELTRQKPSYDENQICLFEI